MKTIYLTEKVTLEEFNLILPSGENGTMQIKENVMSLMDSNKNLLESKIVKESPKSSFLLLINWLEELGYKFK